MNATRLTVILLTLAAVLAAAVPSIRRGLGHLAVAAGVAHYDHYSPVVLREVARGHPDDSALQMAYAIHLDQIDQMGPEYHPDLATHPVTDEDIAAAWEGALHADPANATTRMAYLSELFRYQTFDFPAEAECFGKWRDINLPTQEELEEVREIREHLRVVAGAEPNDAAVWYLLAWTWLAEDEREEVRATLDRAMEADDWSLHAREIGEPVGRLARLTGAPEFLAALSAQTAQDNLFQLQSALVDVAGALKCMTRMARQEGRPEDALRTVRCLLHGAEVMRDRGYGTHMHMISAIYASGAVRGLLPEDAKGLPGRETAYEERERALTMVAADYARNHGAPEIAEEIITERERSQRADRARDAYMDNIWHYWRGLTWAGWPLSMAIWTQTLAFALLAAALLLLWLVLRGWRFERLYEWSSARWLVMLAVLVMPGAVAGAIVAGRMDDPPFDGPFPIFGKTDWMVVGVGLWWIAVIIMAWWPHRGTKGQSFTLAAKSIVQKAIPLLGPTLAALVLLSVIATYPMQASLDRSAQTMKQIDRQSPMDYYGLRGE